MPTREFKCGRRFHKLIYPQTTEYQEKLVAALCRDISSPVMGAVRLSILRWWRHPRCPSKSPPGKTAAQHYVAPRTTSDEVTEWIHVRVGAYSKISSPFNNPSQTPHPTILPRLHIQNAGDPATHHHLPILGASLTVASPGRNPCLMSIPPMEGEFSQCMVVTLLSEPLRYWRKKK